jgi:hypothetical protein
MHCGPMRISSAMTKGPSLASVEEVREEDHVIGSSRPWSEVIRRATHVAARLAREPRLDALIDDVSLTGRAVGRPPAWRAVLKRAIQVAATDTTTCLLGESGVGKEVVARSSIAPHRANVAHLSRSIVRRCLRRLRIDFSADTGVFALARLTIYRMLSLYSSSPLARSRHKTNRERSVDSRLCRWTGNCVVRV